MTIGIAASGPGAGRAILGALARAEAVGTGAIGGFASFACIGPQGLWRCGIQRGGARALLARGLPEEALEAPRAVLMSSGPDRPEPLAQFTPGDAAAGLVTGHRFPNLRGGAGSSPAEAALEAMRAGIGPAEAAELAAAADPDADAGIVCLGLDGRIGMANARHVAAFPGLGQALQAQGGARAGVLCNGIAHGALLAPLIAEMALAALVPPQVAGTVLLQRGLPVLRGSWSELRLGPQMQPEALVLSASLPSGGRWSAGYGPQARLTRDGLTVGRLLDEPFLTGEDGRVESFDGRECLPVRYVAPDPA
ncbi:hypothetical protein [Mangrovicoccus sp. HB161399]|uniref:DUF6963 family protein n=1 Tax=Mangrovicoccus sp. HB161399 TaxID=2720392 RepID=UPI001556566C|nr:hypothetical protein [Mangrovicoccus sp. HB161399]